MKYLHRGFALVALAAAALGVAGCDATPPLAPTETPVVTVSQPLPKEITDYDQYTGRVEAAETVEVRTRVRGEMKEVHLKDGAFINAKDTLFTIDPRPYEANLALAEAKKANAEAS